MSDRVGIIEKKQGFEYFKWKIPEIHLFADEDNAIESPFFYIFDQTPWWLVLHPNGEYENLLAIYLVKNKSTKEYTVSYELGILDQRDIILHKERFSCHYNVKECGYGTPCFFRVSDIQEYSQIVMADGLLNIYLSVEKVEDFPNDYTESHSSKSKFL